MSLKEASEQMIEEEEETSINTGDDQEKEIKRRIRIGKKYHHVKNTIRKQLISRVESKGEKIIDVARELGMKYSTAKSILKVYRSEGRTQKIPKSQRYLSLRTPDPDDYLLETKVQDQTAKKKTTVALEKLSTYAGPVTRLRASNRSKKEKVLVKSEPDETTNMYMEDEKEPLPRKKLAKEITPKLGTKPSDSKEDPSSLDCKQEDSSEVLCRVKAEDDIQVKTLSNESSHENLGISNDSQNNPTQIFSEILPSALSQPFLNPFQYRSYCTDLAQIRIQNIAMYLQSLIYQNRLLKNITNNSHQKQHLG